MNESIPSRGVDPGSSSEVIIDQQIERLQSEIERLQGELEAGEENQMRTAMLNAQIKEKQRELEKFVNSQQELGESVGESILKQLESSIPGSSDHVTSPGNQSKENQPKYTVENDGTINLENTEWEQVIPTDQSKEGDEFGQDENEVDNTQSEAPLDAVGIQDEISKLRLLINDLEHEVVIGKSDPDIESQILQAEQEVRQYELRLQQLKVPGEIDKLKQEIKDDNRAVQTSAKKLEDVEPEVLHKEDEIRRLEKLREQTEPQTLPPETYQKPKAREESPEDQPEENPDKPEGAGGESEPTPDNQPEVEEGEQDQESPEAQEQKEKIREHLRLKREFVAARGEYFDALKKDSPSWENITAKTKKAFGLGPEDSGSDVDVEGAYNKFMEANTAFHHFATESGMYKEILSKVARNETGRANTTLIAERHVLRPAEQRLELQSMHLPENLRAMKDKMLANKYVKKVMPGMTYGLLAAGWGMKVLNWKGAMVGAGVKFVGGKYADRKEREKQHIRQDIVNEIQYKDINLDELEENYFASALLVKNVKRNVNIATAVAAFGTSAGFNAMTDAATSAGAEVAASSVGEQAAEVAAGTEVAEEAVSEEVIQGVTDAAEATSQEPIEPTPEITEEAVRPVDHTPDVSVTEMSETPTDAVTETVSEEVVPDLGEPTVNAESPRGEMLHQQTAEFTGERVDPRIAELMKEIHQTPGYDVNRGDSIWKIVENKFGAHDLFNGMEEGQQLHLIDEIKDKVQRMTVDQLHDFGYKNVEFMSEADLHKYYTPSEIAELHSIHGDNIPNIHKIQAGWNLDFSKIMGGDSVVDAVEHAENLSQSQIDSIERVAAEAREAAAHAGESAAPSAEVAGLSAEQLTAAHQAAGKAAEDIITRDVHEMFGSDGVFGIGSTEGVKSVNWLDIKDHTVTELLNRQEFPIHEPNTLTVMREPQGFDVEPVVREAQDYVRNVIEKTGVQPLPSETVDNYLHRALESHTFDQLTSESTVAGTETVAAVEQPVHTMKQTMHDFTHYFKQTGAVHEFAPNEPMASHLADFVHDMPTELKHKYLPDIYYPEGHRWAGQEMDSLLYIETHLPEASRSSTTWMKPNTFGPEIWRSLGVPSGYPLDLTGAKLDHGKLITLLANRQVSA